MKRLKQSLKLALLLTPLCANAQSTPSSVALSDQITMTSNYAQTILSRIQKTPADRFNISTDYSKIGPVLKLQMETALNEFRSAMDTLLDGSLNDSIDDYNKIYHDPNLGSDEKKVRLDHLFTTIQKQAHITSGIFSGELNELYRFLPELALDSVTREDKVHKRDLIESDYTFHFKSGDIQNAFSQIGTSEGILGGNWDTEFINGTNSFFKVYQIELKAYLFKNCATKSCVDGLLQQLNTYITYATDNLLQDVSIKLADGTPVTISASNPGRGLHAEALTEAIEEFKIDNSINNLPLKN